MPKLVEDIEQHEPDLFGGSPNFLSTLIDKFVGLISILAHLSWILLIAMIILNVVLRYIVGNSSVAIEETQWHLYGFALMIGLSYCLVKDQHVRVDVLAEHWKPRLRARIDFFAMIFLVIPFALVIATEAIPFVKFAYKLNETSRSPGGLGFRWIIKAVIPLSMYLLAFSAAARALRMLPAFFSKSA